MLHVIERACYLFRHNQEAWRAMQIAGMTTDFSWDHSAQVYMDLYQSALNG